MLSTVVVSLSGSTPQRLPSSVPSEDAIDRALQTAAVATLNGREGAIIVMDPQTGRVRSVVNPQLAFTQTMMPGSTMKPFTALAALRAGLIDENSRSTCPGKFTGKSLSLPCVHADHLPPFSPSEAIAYSCNYYFAALGQRMSRDQLTETLRQFGLGQTTGVTENEPSGVMRPCETGNAARIRIVKSDHSLQQSDCDARAAIGESDHIQITPIQLLTAYAALVNGGRVFQPRVESSSNFRANERALVAIAPQHRAIIAEGMRGAVVYGTAKGANLNSLPRNIIGKTGTSLPSKGFRSNGWFVGFAGGDQMESHSIDLAVLVLLTNSHGAEAAELARPIFEAFANETSHRDTEAQRNSTENSALPTPHSAIVRVHLVTENVTQELSLEDYVLGVMRAEGSMESEPEALKALAIAIRTYAVKNRGRHAKDGYEFCSTTHCQRFVTGTASSAIIAAVRTSEGQILTDDRGQPIDSYFGASCGGETANIADLWGIKPASYLSGVRDEYCVSGPHATWTDVIKRANLLRALQSDPRTNVGSRLDNIIVSKQDDTGRAEFITLEGEYRKQVRGWDFKIIVGRVLGWNVLKSSRFEVSHLGPNFILRGSGFGHGLGLCQEGAHVMAARGMNYQKILEKYFPGTRVKPRSGDVSLGRPFRAGIRPREEPFVALATNELALFQSSLTQRTQWSADVIPALKGWATIIRHYAANSALGAKFLTISSEHFRITYPADVDRRDANQVLNTLESARSDFTHRASTASISADIPTLEIRINASVGDFTTRTGQPWWAAAATKENRIELQPITILKRRGVLMTTLKHELAHAVIDSVSHNHAPRWLEEGFAIYLAGEGQSISRYVPRTNISVDELERRLERPRSQSEMRTLYAVAYKKVAEEIKTRGESAVWLLL